VANLRRAAPWVVTALALVVAALLLLPSRGGAGRHPDPRGDLAALAMTVLPSSSFPSPDQARAYQIAREIPQTLDGLYCHCQCKESLRHRSLLTCFQSQHGSGCDICMGEARMAFDMQQQGRTLQDIRIAIDQAYGS
jgi:hypothetical protein